MVKSLEIQDSENIDQFHERIQTPIFNVIAKFRKHPNIKTISHSFANQSFSLHPTGSLQGSILRPLLFHIYDLDVNSAKNTRKVVKRLEEISKPLNELFKDNKTKRRSSN